MESQVHCRWCPVQQGLKLIARVVVICTRIGSSHLSARTRFWGKVLVYVNVYLATLPNVVAFGVKNADCNDCECIWLQALRVIIFCPYHGSLGLARSFYTYSMMQFNQRAFSCESTPTSLHILLCSTSLSPAGSTCNVLFVCNQFTVLSIL